MEAVVAGVSQRELDPHLFTIAVLRAFVWKASIVVHLEEHSRWSVL